MRAVWSVRSIALLVNAAVLSVVVPSTATACAVCVGSSPADHGYFWAVLFLMSMPFAVGGVIGGWLMYTHRRSHGRGRTATSGQPHDTWVNPQRGSLTPRVNERGKFSEHHGGQSVGTAPAVWTAREEERIN